MTSRPRLRGLGAATVMALIAQLVVASVPAQAVEQRASAAGPTVTLTASSTTVEPGATVTFTTSVARDGLPHTNGTLTLLASPEAGSVFDCAVACPTTVADVAPDSDGHGTFTVRMDDAAFTALQSQIRPGTGAPVHFGVRYTGSGANAEQGASPVVAVTAQAAQVPAAASTTVLSVDDATPALGDQVTFTAAVTSAAGPVTSGSVAIRLGSGAGINSPSLTPAAGLTLDANGRARFSATWDADWFRANVPGGPAPSVGTPLPVQAVFTPADFAVLEPSSSSTVTVTPEPVKTQLTLTPPSGSVGHGTSATFTANLPSDAAGTLQVSCPESSCSAEPRPVTGTATFEVKFSNSSYIPLPRTVSATFTSATPKYSHASASTSVTVANGAVAPAPPVPTSTLPLLSSYPFERGPGPIAFATLVGSVGVEGPSTESASPDAPSPFLTSTFSMPLAYLGLFYPGRPGEAGVDDFWITRLTLAITTPGSTLPRTRGAVASGSEGRTKSTAAQLRTTKKTVACHVKDATLTCPMGYFEPGTKISYTASIPLAAAAAGKRVSVKATTSALDPATGRTTVLSTRTTQHTVAKRTAFSGRLKASAKSVKRGKKSTVTAKLTNAGVIKAGKVTSCLSMPKGAKITRAKGAKITKTKTKACWTVTSLKAKKSKTFKMTFVAPKKKGTPKVTWSVKPKKKSQADGFTVKAGIRVK